MNKEKINIGFTVGIWDCFHEAHIIFLKKCHKYCDYLIVGIMTDYWCKVQKGKTRPEDGLQTRHANLQNSNLCDKIVILDTLDMTEYLKIADIWIKGVGQNKMKPEFFKNTVFIPRTPDISTTKILEEKKW
jgi:cytidyltransferase-like protein